MMLVCGCGQPMDIQAVEEDSKGTIALIRFACDRCGQQVGIDDPSMNVEAWADRLTWTNEALHALDRMPPYIQYLIVQQVLDFAKTKGLRVITFASQLQARVREFLPWDPEAEERLSNVPATVRAMARMEIERSAAEAGDTRVTVALMNRVKARYFGMGARTNGER